MLIVCPNCATSYNVDERNLRPEGRTVRCTRCRATWVAAPTSATHALALHASTAAEADAGAVHDGEVSLPAECDAADAAAAAGTPFAPPMAASPPLVPGGERETAPEDDIETAAKPQARIAPPPAPPRGRRPRLAFYVPLLLSVIVAAMAGRTQIVRHFPQAASLFAAVGLPVNLRGLEFRDVSVANATENNVPVLVVQGRIANITTHTVPVAQIRFGVRNAANIEVYAWTANPDKTSLAAGETMSFRSQLGSPPADARTVAVRFVDGPDGKARP